jgi:hypothetical protein
MGRFIRLDWQPASNIHALWNRLFVLIRHHPHLDSRADKQQTQPATQAPPPYVALVLGAKGASLAARRQLRQLA